MGSSSSKGRRKVTKVAPVPSKGERLAPQSTAAMYCFHNALQETNPNIFASSTGRNLILERQLPPLRETWQGRYPTGPQPGVFDLTTEGGAPSIIKQHPPRRLQKLEPFILASDLPPDKYRSLQGASATCRPKEQVKGKQSAIHPQGGRQYLLQMKMLEIRKEEELKRRLHEEARIHKLQTRDLDRRGTLGLVRRNNSSDDEDLLSQTFKRNQGDRWSGELFKEPGPSEVQISQRGKVEAWLWNQQARRESFSDTSSSDSDNWNHPCRRPALVRTKTQRIALFDEFFDKEF
ncbi:factor associated with metabolism and energy [Anolis carolinensis]|uniref:factor associated with metabolism and energy n=1 Tax=Anolis carolinensis TaxID=28377 RepID=UPI002F2B7023